MDHETLPPCPRADCDADREWAAHHWHWKSDVTGAPAAEGRAGELLGLPVFVDPNIPTNIGAATNQDVVFVLKRDHERNRKAEWRARKAELRSGDVSRIGPASVPRDMSHASRDCPAGVSASESPTGSTGGDFRDKLAGDSPDKTIRRWLDRSREYPTTNGRLGWVADRDELIALLSECSPRGISASVIPVAVPGGDMVGFYVQTSIHFARSELSAIGEPRRAAEGVE